MIACEVFDQNNGDITKAWYAEMNGRGVMGQLAVALFRAQKRSTAAKRYRGGRYTRDDYEVKNWSLSEIFRILMQNDTGIVWGWKQDPDTPGFSQVLYVELPGGQCSFHSAERLAGPDYIAEWDGKHLSKERILAFCNSVSAVQILD